MLRLEKSKLSKFIMKKYSFNTKQKNMMIKYANNQKRFISNENIISKTLINIYSWGVLACGAGGMVGGMMMAINEQRDQRKRGNDNIWIICTTIPFFTMVCTAGGLFCGSFWPIILPTYLIYIATE